MSGGKLIGVRNECSLAGKKSVGSKPEDGDEEGKGRPEVDVVVVEKQREQKNSKAGKKPKSDPKSVEPSIYKDSKP